MIVHRLGDSVNFVDGNNVLVGFNTMQDCCENARWWISEDGTEHANEDGGRDLSAYFFDPDGVTEREPKRDARAEEGGSLTFRLVAQDQPVLLLTIANSHNGYYSHGFRVDIGGKTIWEGVL